MQPFRIDPHRLDLLEYYAHAFPFEHIWAWLNSCRHEESPRREFVFVSANKRFTRDLRFSTHHEWQNDMLVHVPARVEVGPQWNTLCAAGTEYANLPSSSHIASKEEMSRIFCEGVRQDEWAMKVQAMRDSVGFHDIAPVHDIDAPPATPKTLVQSTLVQGFAAQGAAERHVPVQQPKAARAVPKFVDPSIQRFPVRRELIFDIDMNDYDDVRLCCQGPKACSTCWNIVWAAVLVLNAFLRQQCDMQHVLWVYSGRRGVHCWTSDQNAMVMSNQQRQVMLALMQVVPRVTQRTLMQAYQETQWLNLHTNTWANTALHLLMPVFSKFWIESVNAQRVPEFETFLDARVRRVFRSRLLPDPSPMSDSSSHVAPSRSARWREFLLQHAQFIKSPKHMQQAGAQSVPDALHRIVFSCLYPRFDIPVTVQMNHLLKLPFCIHPDTLQVCLPFETMRRDQIMSVLRAPKLADIVDCIKHNHKLPHEFRRAVNLMHIKAALIHSCRKNQEERGEVRKAAPPAASEPHELPELRAFGDLQVHAAQIQ
jgi:predicted DNA primase small subunit